MKMSSIRSPKSRAMLCASRIDGLYFPFSSEMIVWRETPSSDANCCYVMPRAFLLSSMWFFIASLRFPKSSSLYICDG